MSEPLYEIQIIMVLQLSLGGGATEGAGRCGLRADVDRWPWILEVITHFIDLVFRVSAGGGSCILDDPPM